MNNKKIIDNDFFHDWGNNIIDKKEIIWKGTPADFFSISTLERGYYHDVATGAVSPLSIILVITVPSIIALFKMDLWWLAIFITTCALVAVFGLDILNYYSRKKTKYAFTKDKVLFKINKWGKDKIHVLHFSDIYKTSYQEYPNSQGIIHFFSHSASNFKTYNFDKGERRHHPTFEMIPNVVEVHEKIEELRKEKYRPSSKTSQYSHKKKAVSKKWLRTTKIIQNIILLYCILFTLDFYFSPIRTMEDHVGATKTHEKEARGNNHVYIGTKYKTENNFVFGTHNRPLKDGASIIVVYTIGLKSVKDIIYKDKSLKTSLASGLHWIPKYFYLFIFIVILIGRFLLSHEAHFVDHDYLVKVVIYNSVFFLIGFYVYHMYN